MSKLDRLIRSKKKPPLGMVGHLAVAVLVLVLSGGLAMGIKWFADPVPPLGNARPVPRAASGESADQLPWNVKLLSGPGDTTIGVVDDPNVVAAVREDYLQAYSWLYLSGPQDPKEVDSFFVDDAAGRGVLAASAIREAIQNFSSKGLFFQVDLGEAERTIIVSNFSVDGGRVHIADVQESPRILRYFDRESGEPVSEQVLEGGVLLSTMVYDQSSGRWRIGSMEWSVLEMPLNEVVQ